MTADALSKYEEEDFPTPGPLVVCDPCVGFFISIPLLILSIANLTPADGSACHHLRWCCFIDSL